MDRLAAVAALASITMTVGLIVAPSAQHRIVENGEDTPRLLDEIRRCASWALAPFALAIGFDTFLVAKRVLGTGAGTVAGLVFCTLAVTFWYVLEILKLRADGPRARAEKECGMKAEATPIDRKIEQMLTETRVMLPGAQALLGFQLIIVFSESFKALPEVYKIVHLAALGCITLSVIWLVAPTAFHRIVYAGEDTESFHRLGTRFMLAASFLLAIGIAGDLGVVVGKVLGSHTAGIGAATLAFVTLVGLWHVYPIILKLHRQRATDTSGEK